MSSKPRKRTKPVPSILRTPIEFSQFSREKDVLQQMQARLSAVYAYFGVQESGARSEQNLIERMTAERFPTAFKQIPRGTPRTKKVIWDCFRKAQLIEFIEGCCQKKGMTQEQAAELFRRRHFGSRGSAKGLVAEYHRAERWSRIGKLTELEVDELMRVERLRNWAKERRADKADSRLADPRNLSLHDNVDDTPASLWLIKQPVATAQSGDPDADHEPRDHSVRFS